MGKKKKGTKKLTPTQKLEKKRRKEMYETIFNNGKQKRVRRSPPEVDYSQINDPIFLMQKEMWEELHAWEHRQDAFEAQGSAEKKSRDDVPFWVRPHV
ncbi:MAG: hypothetical protein K9M45_02795 [Kiritimatiellales bacterium]|nr:hypothetical protein [Kiritimatiellales bacterium]